MSIIPDTSLRLARMEAMCDSMRAELDDVLQNAYTAAVEAQDEDRAAKLARKIRNKLLDSTDKECALDKVLPTAPTTAAFGDWITWLKQLANVATNTWGVYRQQLRDLPQQEGWPYNITWPTKPGEESKEE